MVNGCFIYTKLFSEKRMIHISVFYRNLQVYHNHMIIIMFTCVCTGSAVLQVNGR